MSKHSSGRESFAPPRGATPDAVGGMLHNRTETEKNKKIKDLERQLAKQQELIKLLEKDATTGLLTRTAFRLKLRERLEKPIKRATLISVDLKSVKWVNDTFTHTKGDAFLKGAADRLEDIFPEREDSSLVGRAGGDEFVIFVPDTTDEEEAIIEGYVSYLFDDHQDDDDGCWVPVSDTVEVLLRGRYIIEHIDNGRLTPKGLSEVYVNADEVLTRKAAGENDRGRPAPIRIIEPR